ncbi:heterokaryon incompatibility protein-domain-containing protein [Podospora aff. communis PSN243]|uniref:Heterokaryon incompatibility protein-domain-containing protein n=1 Tax=Podospora aff. communis PSN243 TaxID=3040156 RepID=A0AAV9GC76_9PEZI|nr:heterokaryon incompatibility protein-domain-containing protein [Podospora aff. communis PSN243]
MRLLHAETKKLVEFHGDALPRYAILSHTWEVNELTHRDITGPGASKDLAANKKIHGCCRQALANRLEYVWIDTICIDKSSSAELSEAINTMFAWYQSASICYAYLSDVDSDYNTPMTELGKTDSDLRRSKWFTRGWTLQELIAPKTVVFFNAQWQPIAHKRFSSVDARETRFHRLLEETTRVPFDVLRGKMKPSQASVASRMTWAAGRQTTRVEDRAYCLMGIFGVNMAMLYGEGERAFTRLQEEIIRTSDDESIFAWGLGRSVSDSRVRAVPLHSPAAAPLAVRQTRLMAASPADFEGCENVRVLPSSQQLEHLRRHSTHYSLTNKGLLVERPLLVLPRPFNTVLVPLNCCVSDNSSQIVALPLRGEPSEGTQLQVDPSSRPVLVDSKFFESQTSHHTRLYIDTSIREFSLVLPQISVKVHSRHSASPDSDFHLAEVHPSWFVLDRMSNSRTNFFIRGFSGMVDGQHHNMHALVRLKCPNNQSYLLHFVHALRPVPEGQESTWAAGVMSMGQEDSAVKHIFKTADAGGFPPESASGPKAAWPSVSIDGYLRLDLAAVSERHGRFRDWQKQWTLTIHCGEPSGVE